MNNFPGQNVFEYLPGQVMTRIEVTLPLEGDLNKYPFDRYETTLWLFMSAPSLSMKPLARRGAQDSQDAESLPSPKKPQLPPGPLDTQEEGSDVGIQYRMSAKKYPNIKPGEEFSGYPKK